jgi:hypothetical protein
MALVVPQIPSVSGGAIVLSTPTTSETFVPGNDIYYWVFTVGTAITTTVIVPGNLYGQARPDVAHSIGTNSNRCIGPLVTDLADPTTGLVTITHSATTAVTAAAVQCGSR